MIFICSKGSENKVAFNKESTIENKDLVDFYSVDNIHYFAINLDNTKKLEITIINIIFYFFRLSEIFIIKVKKNI